MEALDGILQWLERRWDGREAPVVVPLFASAAAFLFANFANMPLWGQLAAAAIAATGSLAIWWVLHRPPKASGDRIGFLVAVSAEREAERIRVTSDFLGTLRQIFEAASDIAPVEVLEIPPYHAARIIDTSSAKRYLRKCRGHFLAFGTASTRKLANRDFYVLKLRGVVVHTPIPDQVSKDLSREMDAVLPQRVRIACESDIDGFELTSRLFSDGAKFVIATAALLSHDFDLAERLLVDLHNKRKELKSVKAMPGVKALLNKLTDRLADAYQCQGRRMHLQWRRSRREDVLDRMKDYATKLKRLKPKVDGSYLALAIWHFVRHRDVASAEREVRICETLKLNSVDAKYSLAFLHAYQGDLRRAEAEYLAAFRMARGHATPFEVEEFLEWLLAVEPDKCQIYYCLGLINMHVKGDYDSAVNDFEQFIEQAGRHGVFSEAVVRAKGHLQRLREQVAEAVA